MMNDLPQSKSTKSGQVWYKNYMVLIFVIAMPLAVVIACIYLVIYSVQIKDTVVRDDWYMDGKTLYADVSKDKLSYDMGLSATMYIANDGKVVFDLQVPQGSSFNKPKTLNVEVSHATQIDKDRDFTISLANDGRYIGELKLDSQAGKYYIVVHDVENTWRLRSTYNLPTNDILKFQPLKVFDEENTQTPKQ